MFKIGDLVHWKYNSRHGDYSQPYIIIDAYKFTRLDITLRIKIKKLKNIHYNWSRADGSLSYQDDFLFDKDKGEYSQYIREQKLNRIINDI